MSNQDGKCLHGREERFFTKRSFAGLSEKGKREKERQGASGGKAKAKDEKARTGKKGKTVHAQKLSWAGAFTVKRLQSSPSKAKSACTYPLSSAESYEQSYITFQLLRKGAVCFRAQRQGRLHKLKQGREGRVTRSPHLRRRASCPRQGG